MGWQLVYPELPWSIEYADMEFSDNFKELELFYLLMHTYRFQLIIRYIDANWTLSGNTQSNQTVTNRFHNSFSVAPNTICIYIEPVDKSHVSIDVKILVEGDWHRNFVVLPIEELNLI